MSSPLRRYIRVATEVPDMPHGTAIDVTGTLLRDGRRLILAVSGGGEWVIDPPLFTRIEQLIGHRVRVIGTRGGFNLIDARCVEPG